MAEFLIRKKIHDFDFYNQLKINSLSVKEKQKYDARYIPGDIVQVYEDGALTREPSKNCAHYLLKVPELKFDKEYEKPELDKEQNLILKRKYNLNISILNLDSSKINTITITQFNNALESKV